MRLEEIPRRPLALLPTPLHELPRLSTAVGGVPIWIKRDDLTGFALGGNKVRKLEFLLAPCAREPTPWSRRGASRATTPG